MEMPRWAWDLCLKCQHACPPARTRGHTYVGEYTPVRALRRPDWSHAWSNDDDWRGFSLIIPLLLSSSLTIRTNTTMAGRRASTQSRSASPVPLRSNGSNSNRRTASRQNSNTQQKDKNTFNPRLIFSQIIALQCFHYLILGFIIQFNSILFSTTVTIDRIFTDRFLNVWSVSGWVDNSATLLSYIAG